MWCRHLLDKLKSTFQSTYCYNNNNLSFIAPLKLKSALNESETEDVGVFFQLHYPQETSHKSPEIYIRDLGLQRAYEKKTNN